MRLTLLITLLFSLLGGCAASSSHGVVVPKLVCYSGKQPSSEQYFYKNCNQVLFIAGTADNLSSDDIDDDDDREDLVLRKYKALVRAAFTFLKTTSLHSGHSYHVTSAPLYGNSSPRYITLRTLRV